MKKFVYSLAAILFALTTFTACNNWEDETTCPSCDGLGEFINWCGSCAGLGYKVNVFKCSHCGGKGENYVGNPCDECEGSGSKTSKSYCNWCYGNGYTKRTTCKECKGEGVI